MAATMIFDLEVWTEGSDEPQLVRADQRDLAAFELKHKVGSRKAMDIMIMVFFRYIGWAALRRTGQIDSGLSYDEWDKTIVSVEEVEEEDQPDPTTPAA